MIRYRLGELIADKQFNEGRRITLLEIAEKSGVSRMTLSRMINQRGYCTVTDNLDLLCAYFECRLEDLAEYVPNREVKTIKKVANTRARGLGRKT